MGAPLLIKRRGVTDAIGRYFGFKSRLVCFDTEGTGLIPYGPPKYWGYYPAAPFAYAFCDAEGNIFYDRWEVDPKTRRVIPPTTVRGRKTAEMMRRLLESDDYIKLGHHLAYDMRLCKAANGWITRGECHDSMVLAHVVTAGDELQYGLKPLAKKYLAYPDDDEKRLENAVKSARMAAKAKGYLIAGGKKEVERGDFVVFAGNKPVKADYWLAPPELCEEYAIGDVKRSMLLFLMWWETVNEDSRSLITYSREMHLFHALRRMEDRGTAVYPAHTDKLIKFYQRYMVKQEEAARANGGEGMNFQSPKQLIQKFYIEKGYTPKFNDNKNMTLDKHVLAELGATDIETGEYKDPLAKAILEWRAAKQTIKSFLNIYSKFWYPEDAGYQPTGTVRLNRLPTKAEAQRWRKQAAQFTFILHPNYNQTGAITGRLTCSDPNLQQVASATTGLRKADIPQRPRECFGPRPGHLWYLPDYSQIEVWLFAFLSGEPNMQGLLLGGHDFHQGVADRVFVNREDYEARKAYYRKLSKLIMFGKLYGGGVGTPEKPGRMTLLLQQPWAESAAFIRQFDNEFAEALAFMRRMSKEAKGSGEAFNVFGRRYVLGAEWAYKVVNYLIQGAAADVLKNAIIRLDWMLRTRWPGVHLINTIHDEMMIEVPYASHCLRLMREIIWVMQMDSDQCNVPVPLPVGMKLALKRWSHPTELKGLPKWITGGIPRDDHAATFHDLAEHMRRCPYTQTEDGARAQFAKTATVTGIGLRHVA
jgi:DNA polymerase I-like protein with 3'-5' exonuclease and polymerase domains